MFRTIKIFLNVILMKIKHIFLTEFSLVCLYVLVFLF